MVHLYQDDGDDGVNDVDDGVNGGVDVEVGRAHLVRVKGKPCGLYHLVFIHLANPVEEEEKDGDYDQKDETWVLQSSKR